MKTLTVICPLILNCLLVTNANAITSYQISGSFSSPGVVCCGRNFVMREAFDFPGSFAFNFDIDESTEADTSTDTYAYFENGYFPLGGREMVTNVSLTYNGVTYSAPNPRAVDDLSWIEQRIKTDSSHWNSFLVNVQLLDFLTSPLSPVVFDTANPIYPERINWNSISIGINLTDLDGDIYAETVTDLITLNNSEFETKEITIIWDGTGVGYNSASYSITANIDTITVIPLPTAIWLFGYLVVWFGWYDRMGRRKRR